MPVEDEQIALQRKGVNASGRHDAELHLAGKPFELWGSLTT
jgi:hypothetical protein